MRITISKDFDSVEAAAAFVARIEGDVTVAATPATDKPARKPRADAGKTREPYGPRTQTTELALAAAQAHEAQRPEPQAPASVPVSAPVPTGGEQKAVTPAVAPAAEFPATLDGARAAMKKLNDTKGKGMDACIAALKAHGVNRISDLPKEKFADFIKYVVGQL